MSKFCSYCGNELKDDDKFCGKCGAGVEEKETKRVEEGNTVTYTDYNMNSNNGAGQKSKLAAGLFGIFLGSLGVHNFYLGFEGKAITQLLLTVIGWIFCGIGPAISAIWGLVEGIIILADDTYKDANGNKLKD